MTQHILAQANILQNAIKAFMELLKDFSSSRKEISEAKKTIFELNKLSDADLADIGLCRGDIWNVAHHKHDDIRRRF
jgi:uncharacterized protein YjiS (DUF1127 family)